MADDLKRRSIKGVAWAASESFGVAAISLVSFIVLARILAPQDFGVVALAIVFIYFCNIVTGHGFADAIVQRHQLEPEHLDTAFWSTLGIALLLMLGCLAGAGPLAALLDEPQLAGVLRWLSLVLPLSAISTVQMALFRRDMRFDAVARRTLVGRTLGAAVGIAMAVSGYGLWSLVAQQLVGQLALTLAFVIGPWRPRWRFSIPRLREMWGFGLNVSATQVVIGAGEQTLTLMIGALFGTTTLGYFTIAWRAVQLIKSLVSGTVYHVGLRAFSKLQQDRGAVAEAFLNATRISCLVGFPMALGIALVAEPLVVAAFETKWLASVPLLAVLALELVPAFFGMFRNALFRAMNRPGWGLAMSCSYTVLGLGGVFAVASFGIEAAVAAWVARLLILMPVHVALVSRLLSLPATRVVAPAMAPLVTTALMAASVLLLQFFLPHDLGSFATLGIVVPAAAAVYAGAVCLLYPELARFAWRTATVLGSPRAAPQTRT